jgi:hypothetical protein
MKAMGAEPVLQAAAVIAPPVRDYLLRAMAVLQQKSSRTGPAAT